MDLGWRDGSTVKTLPAPTEGPGPVLGTRMPAHNLLCPVPEDQVPSSGFHEYFTHMTHTHTGRHT